MATDFTYTDSANTTTIDTVERWSNQLMSWCETDRIPHKVYWKRHQKKAISYTHIPDNNIFNNPFRKHRFKVGGSKK